MLKNDFWWLMRQLWSMNHHQELLLTNHLPMTIIPSASQDHCINQVKSHCQWRPRCNSGSLRETLQQQSQLMWSICTGLQTGSPCNCENHTWKNHQAPTKQPTTTTDQQPTSTNHQPTTTNYTNQPCRFIAYKSSMPHPHLPPPRCCSVASDSWISKTLKVSKLPVWAGQLSAWVQDWLK